MRGRAGAYAALGSNRARQAVHQLALGAPARACEPAPVQLLHQLCLHSAPALSLTLGLGSGLLSLRLRSPPPALHQHCLQCAQLPDTQQCRKHNCESTDQSVHNPRSDTCVRCVSPPASTQAKGHTRCHADQEHASYYICIRATW